MHARLAARRQTLMLAALAVAAAFASAQEGPPAKRPAAANRLPWEDLPPRVAEPVLRPPAGAREILQRYDIGPSQLDGFFHGQPLSPGEEDVLGKILFRLPRLGLDNVERWRKQDVTWDQLAASPSEYRAEVFALRGRATHVQEQRLLPELAVLLEFEKYYRVTLAIDDSPYEALVCTRHLPAAWKIGEPIDERAAADGLFLKLGAANGAAPQLIFAAGRMAWLPDREHPAEHVGADQLALAELGFDVGLLDSVRAVNGRGLVDADREAFYQLLAALGRAEPAQLRGASRKFDVVPLLERPQEHHGDFLAVQGIARRIMKVPVSDRDVQRRFGIDHYYEIDLFVPLGDKALRFGKDRSGEKNPVYANAFPATLVVRRLPPGLAEGDNLSDTVRADAVFFKLWTYRSVYTSQFDRVQPAPLLVAIEPQVVRFERPANWVGGALVAAAFVLAALVIGTIFWWYRAGDQQAEQRHRRELTGAGSPPPDFKGLS